MRQLGAIWWCLLIWKLTEIISKNNYLLFRFQYYFCLYIFFLWHVRMPSWLDYRRYRLRYKHHSTKSKKCTKLDLESIGSSLRLYAQSMQHFLTSEHLYITSISLPRSGHNMLSSLHSLLEGFVEACTFHAWSLLIWYYTGGQTGDNCCVLLLNMWAVIYLWWKLINIYFGLIKIYNHVIMLQNKYRDHI